MLPDGGIADSVTVVFPPKVSAQPYPLVAVGDEGSALTVATTAFREVLSHVLVV